MAGGGGDPAIPIKLDIANFVDEKYNKVVASRVKHHIWICIPLQLESHRTEK